MKLEKFPSSEKKTAQITKVEPEIILNQNSKKEKNPYIMKKAISILLVTLIIVGIFLFLKKYSLKI